MRRPGAHDRASLAEAVTDLPGVQASARPEATAERDTAKEKLKTLPKVERAAIRLATAFQVVFDTTSEQADTETGEVTPPKAMREQVEAVIPRQELAAAIAAVFELTPPLDSDADEGWRAMLVIRFGTVRPFLRLLVETAADGAAPVMLAAGAQQAEPAALSRTSASPLTT